MSEGRAGTSLSGRLAATPLSPALRRVAELLLVDPEAVAYGTAASVAAAAGTSPPTAVRLATALGYDGFAALRDAARAELGMRLATDAVRARAARPDDPLAARREAEHAVIDRTLDGLAPGALDAAVDLLAAEGAHTWVLPSAQTAGVALRLADQLAIIGRPATLLDGSEMRVLSQLGEARPGDVVCSMDVPRHEHALVRAQQDAVRRGARPVVLTGPPATALVTEGGVVLPFATASVGPFDSLVGLTVLVGLLVDGVIARHPDTVAARLAALERTWTTAGLYET